MTRKHNDGDLAGIAILRPMYRLGWTLAEAAGLLGMVHLKTERERPLLGSNNKEDEELTVSQVVHPPADRGDRIRSHSEGRKSKTSTLFILSHVWHLGWDL